MKSNEQKTATTNKGAEQMKDALKIPRNLIVVDEKENPRTDYGDIEELSISIIENGIKIPLTAYFENGKYHVKSGFRRMRAVNLAEQKGHKFEFIPMLIESRPLNKEERTLEHLTSNDGKPFTMLEQAEVIRRLLNFGWEVTQIVKRTGKARGYIENLILLVKTPVKIQNLIRDGKISAHAVIQIMQAVKGDSEKALKEVEIAISNAITAGKEKATPKHVGEKKVKGQSFGKFYKWMMQIDDELAKQKFIIKDRKSVFDQVLFDFENGKSAVQVAREFFVEKGKAVLPSKAVEKKPAKKSTVAKTKAKAKAKTKTNKKK